VQSDNAGGSAFGVGRESSSCGAPPPRSPDSARVPEVCFPNMETTANQCMRRIMANVLEQAINCDRRRLRLNSLREEKT
jgi:hypothetical protein